MSIILLKKIAINLSVNHKEIKKEKLLWLHNIWINDLYILIQN